MIREGKEPPDRSDSLKQNFSQKEEVKQPLPFQGAIFDLDGVVTSTARQHFAAWKHMFEVDAGVGHFSHKDYLDFVDGKKRDDGIRALLRAKGHSVSKERIDSLAAIKQGYFLKIVAEQGVEVFESTVALIRELQDQRIRLALASSSKNAPFILQTTGLSKSFEVIVAGDTLITERKEQQVAINGKPAPDIFLLAARMLGLEPHQVIGFEDADSGIKALKAAGIMSVGINREQNSALEEAGPDLMVADASELSLSHLAKAFEQFSQVKK